MISHRLQTFADNRSFSRKLQYNVTVHTFLTTFLLTLHVKYLFINI